MTALIHTNGPGAHQVLALNDLVRAGSNLHANLRDAVLELGMAGDPRQYALAFKDVGTARDAMQAWWAAVQHAFDNDLDWRLGIRAYATDEVPA